ncbi:MAG: hypothetical protein GXP45_01365 [bacterium]|nr:hypothetical protein [bacterium]
MCIIKKYYLGLFYGMKTYQKTLIIMFGVMTIFVLFFIGNPRNTFVKKVRRTYIVIKKDRQEHQITKRQEELQ